MQRTLLKVAVLALAGVALYAMAGYWVAPRVVERKLVATVAQKTDLTLAIEAVAVNPFTLALSLNNVTLFRPQSTPAVSIGGLDARMRAGGLGEWSLVLRDVAIRALEVADFSGQEAVLTVPGITTERLVIGPTVTAPAVIRLNRPTLRLEKESTGTLNLPYDLASLLPDPAAAAGVRFEVSDGSVEFSDQSMRMPVRFDSSRIDGTIARRSTRGTAAIAMSLRGRVFDTGRGEINAEWLPARPRDATRIEFGLRDVELARISPYAAEAIGRRILDGRMDLTMNLILEQAELDLDNRFAIRNLQLGRHVGNPGAADLPVELAAALLEDKGGLIAMRVPVARRSLDHEVSLGTVLPQALADYIAAVAGAPFEKLAELAGRTDLDLGSVAFQPGSAEISGSSRAKLTALQQTLAMRPGLGLTVYPGFDHAADSDALARGQILLHVNLATSAGRPGEHGANPVDLDDPKVRSVLDEFAASRLPPSRLATIAGRFPERDTAHFRAVFEALVENEDVAMSALDRLARYRARSVFDELVSLGTDRNRLRLADEILLTGSGSVAGGAIRLEVQHRDWVR